MWKSTIASAVMLGASLSATAAQAEIVLDVLYAFPNNYRDVKEDIAERFEAEHPDIRIAYRTPAENYDVATSQVLRDRLVGSMPDVFFTGGNYMRILSDQELAVPLNPFVKSAQEWRKMGYLDSMLSLARLDGHIYGLPFATSVPVVYVNADLVERAGLSVDALPTDLQGLARAGQQIAELGNDVVGFYHDYGGAGNYNLQVVVNSFGGTMGSDDGCSVAFGTKPVMKALETFEMLHREGMPEMSQNQVRAAFAAGTVGIWVSSTSKIAQMEEASQDNFEFRVLPYPLASQDGRIPAGGAIAVMLAQDAERQAAAWDFIRFATGAIGQTQVAKFTGYMPSSQLAIETPDLLGNYYRKFPNKLVGASQLPVLTGWYNWAGQNAVKIRDVVQDHIEDVVFGRRTAKETLPEMITDVEALLADACA